MTAHPKELLGRGGLEPKQSLGQNFLFDENILARICDAADIGPQDIVLEIGPGLGALTRQLAARAGQVVAVELDDRLLPLLHEELAGCDNVRVVHGDILDQDLAALFSGPYKVIANVPYYITGAILRHLLSGAHKPEQVVMTVQEEVAGRITAVPPAMSLLAVSVQYYGPVRRVMGIKAGAFWPRPDVDSAVVRIDILSDNADEAGEEVFFRIVRAGFSQKRKQLQKNLRQLGHSREQIDAALQEAGIDGRRRAETLTLDEWRALVAALAAS
jgi:16S rRNA (adenine1518-N6/adenine1519-N6)-dimethyltransferase